jgi:hypothetical protein
MIATRHRILPETDDFVRDLRAALPADTLAWVERHETTTRGIAWRALAEAGERTAKSVIDPTAARAWFMANLDTSFPSRASAAIERPPLPRTLAELRAACEDAGLTIRDGAPLQPAGRRNPAPIRAQSHGYGQSASKRYHGQQALSSLGLDRSAGPGMERAATREVDRLAWAFAAPEGFPPVPRRGGKYSPDEAAAIRDWLTEQWGPWRDGIRIALDADQALREAGVMLNATRLLLGDRVGNNGNPMLDLWNRAANHTSPHAAKDPDDDPYGTAIPYAAGKSPTELIDALLRWAALHLFRTIGLIANLADPTLYNRWADPDAHMLALGAVTVGAPDPFYDATERAPRVLYGIGYHLKIPGGHHRHHDGASVLVKHWIAAYYGASWAQADKNITLSQAIALQVSEDTAYKERHRKSEAEHKRDLDTVREALGRGIIARGLSWTPGNIARLLPSGFRVAKERERSVYIEREGSGLYVFVGDARKTRTAQYDDLRKTLGL